MKLLRIGALAMIIFVLSTPTLIAQQFGPPTFYAIGTLGATPEAMVAADFNNDGVIDVATTANAFRLLTVSLGKGDGTFQPAIRAKWPPLGTTPMALAVGDFNKDGIPDLVSLLWNSNSPGWAVVWLGNGDGTFHQSAQFQVGMSPGSEVVADYNGDGNLDIATVTALTKGVSVFLGNGDGTFQPGVVYNSTKASLFVTAGDLNGDGFPDLVETNQDGSVSVLLNSGTGTFPSAANYSTSDTLTEVTVGDVNGDGKPDVVICVQDPVEQAVAVFLNQGNGTLGTPTFYDVTAAGTVPSGIVIADFNKDGKQDLAVVNGTKAPGLFYGNGDGTFQNVIALNDGPKGGTGIVTADFNKDGAPDLAFTVLSKSPKLAVLLNTQ